MTQSQGTIKVMTIEELEAAASFAWGVYQDDTKRTTPPYHSLEATAKHFTTFIIRDSEYLLGYFEEDKLMGVMPLIIEHENKYCSVSGPYIENVAIYDDVANALMVYVRNMCKGYQCYVGTTKTNFRSQRFFESLGFDCVEDTVQTRVFPNTIKAVSGPYMVETLTEMDYDLYRAFHSEHFADYYWTADRIYQKMDQWDISIVKINGEIVGSVFTRIGEVYGGMVLPMYKDTTMLSQLYYKSVSTLFERWEKEIVNFVPEGEQLDAALRVGFEAYDTYLCYENKSL